MKLLIEYGANVNKRGKSNETVLLIALKKKTLCHSKILIEERSRYFCERLCNIFLDKECVQCYENENSEHIGKKFLTIVELLSLLREFL